MPKTFKIIVKRSFAFMMVIVNDSQKYGKVFPNQSSQSTKNSRLNPKAGGRSYKKFLVLLTSLVLSSMSFSFPYFE